MSSVEDLKKALEQKAKTLAELNKQCRHTWRICKDCLAHCEFKDTEQFKGKWVSLEDALIVFDKTLAEKVSVPRKQLSDLYFETVADIHRYYEDIMERFNDDDMSVEQKDELLSTRFLRLDYFPKELKVLLEASDSLSPKEVKDVAIARKELASGKCKTFKTADEMIADLHENEYLAENHT